MKFLKIIALTLIVSCSHTDLIKDNYSPIIPQDLNITEHPRHKDFQQFLDKYRSSGLPGSIMLIKTREGLWIGSSGKADIKNEQDMHPFNISRVGSISKLFFSTAVMTLVESGELKLDDRIDKYLPSEVVSKVKNSNIATIRQLLNHTSGIVNDTDNTNSALDFLFDTPGKNYTYKELVSTSYNRESYFTPGEGWHYSNTGYNLLGYIIESSTGKSHWEVLNNNIIKPLNLSYTYYSPESKYPKGLARGYFDMYGDNTIYDSSNYSSFNFCPAAGVISTPYDLMIFITSLFNNTLISSSSLKEMITTVKTEDEVYINECGLGLFKWETPYGVAYGHGGQVWGYRSELYYFPETETTISFVVNGTFGNIDKRIKEMKEAIPELLISH